MAAVAVGKALQRAAHLGDVEPVGVLGAEHRIRRNPNGPPVPDDHGGTQVGPHDTYEGPGEFIAERVVRCSSLGKARAVGMKGPDLVQAVQAVTTHGQVDSGVHAEFLQDGSILRLHESVECGEFLSGGFPCAFVPFAGI
jgi:hypothetical protein